VIEPLIEAGRTINSYAILPQFSFWAYALVVVARIEITILSVTLFLHRNQTHQSIILHPIVSHFMRFWLWFTTSMLTKAWVAVHRKHHQHVETEHDPHSPRWFGLAYVSTLGVKLYHREAGVQETLEKYGKGTPEDWLERNVYGRFNTVGVVVMFVLDLLLFGLPGLIMAGIQIASMPLFAAGVINGIGHAGTAWGYRNRPSEDDSRNIIPWGILLGGEELHANHHDDQNSPTFAQKKWEIDMGYLVTRVLCFLRLASIRHTKYSEA
jgi:stearoyl-CoA desaturase (delta-9 desaturase)